MASDGRLTSVAFLRRSEGQRVLSRFLDSSPPAESFSTIIQFVSKRAFILVLLVSVRVHPQSVIQGPECSGVIHGAVFGRSGHRMKGITVVAWPLGVDLAALLPSVATDETGEYRFEHVCPGRYTVVVEDKNAGYPDSSPAMNQFLYGGHTAGVKLTAKHPQVELPLYVPPKPGLMEVQVSNGETKAEVLKFTVKLTVSRQRRREAAFEFDPKVRDREIQIPPDQDVILHVTADGFREWHESAGHGKLMHIASGTQVPLEVKLEPLK